MVVPDTGGPPSSIVTRGVTLVELESVVRVPAHVQDGHTEWTLSCGGQLKLVVAKVSTAVYRIQLLYLKCRPVIMMYVRALLVTKSTKQVYNTVQLTGPTHAYNNTL